MTDGLLRDIRFKCGYKYDACEGFLNQRMMNGYSDERFFMIRSSTINVPM